MKVKQLPVRPSKLIEVALKDLTSVERSKKYTVNMEHWAKRDKKSNICSVCLGGATLMKSVLEKTSDMDGLFQVDNVYLDIDQEKIGDYNYHLISALDYLRGYDFPSFLFDIQWANRKGNNYKYIRNINIREVSMELTEEFYCNLPEYRENPKMIKKNMKTVAKKLKEMGL